MSISYATSSSFGLGDVGDFLVEMAVGAAVGIGGAMIIVRTTRTSPLPREGLIPVRTLALAGLIYGGATLLHGSGFLAVFVAGVWVGDARMPFKGEIERFHSALASLGEIVVFAAIGLTDPPVRHRLVDVRLRRRPGGRARAGRAAAGGLSAARGRAAAPG